MGLKLTDPRVDANTDVSVVDAHTELQQLIRRVNGNYDITYFVYKDKAAFDAGKQHFDFITLYDVDAIPAVGNAIEAAVRADNRFPTSTPA